MLDMESISTDAEECWDFCHSRGIKGIFPPRKGAWNCKGEVLPRDEHYDSADGKKKWKKRSGYSRRSIAEAAKCQVSFRYFVQLSCTLINVNY